MYVPIGWPRKLSIGPCEVNANLKCVVCNRFRMLFAIIADATISVWHCRPCVEIVCYQRSYSSLSNYGTNEIAEWRQDSSMLAVATSKNTLLIYQLEQDVKGQKGLSLYEYVNTKTLQGDSNDAVPALRLSLKHNVNYDSVITSLSCVHDNLLVSTRGGDVELLSWTTATDNRRTVSINEIEFFVDLFQNTGTKMKTKGVNISELKYSPYMDGFAVVLSNGRAALMIMSTNQGLSGAPVAPSDWQMRCVWASGLNNAVCTSVNNKYRLLAFGTSLGRCDVYCWDDVTGSLQLSHEIALSKVNYPQMHNKTGSVSCMQWSPDGCTLALSWTSGGFSVWTVYGACLMCTLTDEHTLTLDGTRKQLTYFKSMCWGAEGYHLWAIWKDVVPSHNENDPYTNNDNRQMYSNLSPQHSVEGDLGNAGCEETSHNSSPNDTSAISDGTGELLQINFLKSALTMNPCASNHLHVFLQGEDRLLMSYGERLSENQRMGKPEYIFDNNIDIDRIVGNKQWAIVQMPISYLNGNWPIRYTAIDNTGQLISIAGNFGLAHYSNISRKWKLFGNIMQEKDMVVTGGLAWWRNFIIVACFDLLNNQDEVRIYPRSTNLDNVFATTHKISSQILLVNVYHNILIVFDAACNLSLFVIGINDNVQHDCAILQPLKVLSVAQFVPYPSLVVSVTMTSLHMEGRRSHGSNSHQETDVIIINVAGRLLLFQRQWDEQNHLSETDLCHYDITTHKRIEINFSNPIVLASSVENIWATEQQNRERIHLSDALWLNCGSAGLRVWLPLFPHPSTGTSNKHRDFQVLQSRRITLNLEPDTCYPLTVLFQNAIVLGVKSETNLFKCIGEGSVESSLYNFPYATVERTSQVYLHQILRQLLRRNLGYHALQLALSCRSLPYFPHVLELMLHKVVEEEATASAPIPDPLLPTVVKFLGEFPEYLQTIVHCARKTEIALWQYLFNSVGVPRELFQECLDSGQLETAASYLIILQNLEKLSVARQDATKLLDCALQAKKWNLASDITRFLKAIGVGEGATSPRHPTLMNTNIYPAVAPGNINTVATDSDMYTVTRKRSDGPTTIGRQYSMLTGHPDRQPYRQTGFAKDDSAKHPQIKASLSMPSPSLINSESTDRESEKRTLVTECAEHYFIDIILARQAKRLLADVNLKDLFTFAAHLGFPLVPWLRKERNRVARVTDAVKTLKQIHENFEWPYPKTKASPSTLYKAASSLSSASLSSLDQQLRNTKLTTSVSEDSYIMVPQNTLLDAQRQFQQDESPFHSTTLDGSSGVMLSREQRGSSWTLNAFSEASELSETLDGADELCIEELIDVIVDDKPPKADMQLTFILELMLEADCLELAVIASLIMADCSAIHRVVHSARSNEHHVCPLDTLQRTRDCIVQIEKWAAAECMGYVAVMHKMHAHLHELHMIVNSREVKHAEEQAMLAMNPSNDKKKSHSRTYSSDKIERESLKSSTNKTSFSINLPGKAQPANEENNECDICDKGLTIKRTISNNTRCTSQATQSNDNTPVSTPVNESGGREVFEFTHTRTLSSPPNITSHSNSNQKFHDQSSDESEHEDESGCVLS